MAQAATLEPQIQAYKDAFEAFDKNGDGTITLEELRLLVRGIGRGDLTDAHLEETIQKLDKNRNGTIDYDEFLDLMTAPLPPTHNDHGELYEAFCRFDKNGDGLITTAELGSVMESIGERLTDEQVQLMINEADLNGDNVINFEEFKKMVSTAQN